MGVIIEFPKRPSDLRSVMEEIVRKVAREDSYNTAQRENRLVECMMLALDQLPSGVLRIDFSDLQWPEAISEEHRQTILADISEKMYAQIPPQISAAYHEAVSVIFQLNQQLFRLAGKL